MTSDHSRFTEKETAAIIKRALELQRGQGGGDPAGGHDLEEIERIGSEVGILPDLIRKAAEEIRDHGRDFSGSFWLGARSVQFKEAKAPAPAAGRTLAELLPVIDEAAGLEGEGRVIGDVLQWRSRMGLLRVSVKAAGGGAVATRAEMRIYPAAAGLFPGIVGGLGLGAGLGVGLGVGIAVLASPAFCVAVPLVALASSWLLARSIYRRVARSASGRVRRVVDAVRRTLSSAAR